MCRYPTKRSMLHLVYVLLLWALLAMACNLPRPSAPATTLPHTPEAESTLSAEPATQPPPTATLTPTGAPTQAPTSTATPTATPDTPPATQPPIPAEYVVEDERTIAGYLVQVWRSTADESMFYDRIATISADEQLLVRIEFGTLGQLTETDITGEGNPDVIIESYSGGAHCCFTTTVYDLGTQLTKVLDTPPSNCGGRFEDVDADGVYEFLSCDDLFAYLYCPYAGSPAVSVVMQYQPGQGYLPASPRFAVLYEDAISAHTTMAQQAVSGEMGEWDGTTKCAVLPLVLDYLYTGRPAQAWQAMEDYYTHDDRELFWAEIVRSVGVRPFYTAVAPLPEVALPDYYMLQLLTPCGLGEQWVGFLAEGQEPCSPGVPRRDIYWLQAEVYTLGLLSDDEVLAIKPDGCTTDCRIDVVRSSDSARVASIRLDTTVGFPGAIYRTNGAESSHWRLRGDLTWEQISP